MVRIRALPLLVLACLACSGGDSDPTEPEPFEPPPVIGSWRQLANAPEPISSSASGIVFQGRIYVIGGAPLQGGELASKTAYRYDPATDRWERLPDLPEGRSAPGLAVWNDQLLVLGGSRINNVHSPTSDIWVWDPDWAMWHTWGALPVPAAGPAVGSTPEGVLVARLGDEFAPAGDSLHFLPAGSSEWRKASPVPGTTQPRNASGGLGGIWAMHPTWFARYAVTQDRWDIQVEYGQQGQWACGVVTPAGVHAFHWSGSGSTHLIYDLASTSWKSAAPPQEGLRRGAICLALGDRVYYLGGADPTGFTLFQTLQVFEP